MKILTVFRSAFMMIVQFWQVSVAVWQVWYRHVKHVFAILHYIENEVILGHNKTRTSKIKNQKWDVRVHRRSKKIHPATKIGNVLFAKSHPEHEHDKILTCLFKKRSSFDPRSPHDYDVSFCQKDWEELLKAKKRHCQYPPVYFNHFFQYFCHNTHGFFPFDCLRYWVSLNLYAERSFYEQLSKHRDNQTTKNISLLMSKKVPQLHDFLFVKVWLQHQLYMKF